MEIMKVIHYKLIKMQHTLLEVAEVVLVVAHLVELAVLAVPES